MKQEMLKQFDSLMSHLNSEENELASEFREQLEALFETKQLYVLAGTSDSYVGIGYTMDKEVADRIWEGNEEYYIDDGGFDSLTIPVFVSYADLGITDPLEGEE